MFACLPVCKVCFYAYYMNMDRRMQSTHHQKGYHSAPASSAAAAPSAPQSASAGLPYTSTLERERASERARERERE